MSRKHPGREEERRAGPPAAAGRWRPSALVSLVGGSRERRRKNQSFSFSFGLILSFATRKKEKKKKKKNAGVELSRSRVGAGLPPPCSAGGSGPSLGAGRREVGERPSWGAASPPRCPPLPGPQRLRRVTLGTPPATPAPTRGQGVKIHKEEKKRIIYIKSLSDLKATQTAP